MFNCPTQSPLYLLIILLPFPYSILFLFSISSLLFSYLYLHSVYLIHSDRFCTSSKSFSSHHTSFLFVRVVAIYQSIIMYSNRLNDNYSEIYPDFCQSPVWNRRILLREELERADMLERRMQLDIPEFYVGSIVAVTTTGPWLGAKEHRFVGICIRREKQGLLHQFTLRNFVDGQGVEVMYELYNPTIRKIETLKLEKRLDDDLSYLIDAYPEYSTFDPHMEPVAHTAGTPVPVNPLKVKLRPPPWTRRWEIMGPAGVSNAWEDATPWFKRKFHKTKVNDYEKYDLIAAYRTGSTLEHELKVEEEMQEFERQRHAAGLTRRRIFRSAAAAK